MVELKAFRNPSARPFYFVFQNLRMGLIRIGGAGDDVERACDAIPFHRQCSSAVAVSAIQVLTERSDQHCPDFVLFCARGFGALVRNLRTLSVVSSCLIAPCALSTTFELARQV